MYLYEKNKDKVLVYDLISKDSDILDYKKQFALNNINENWIYTILSEIENLNDSNLSWFNYGYEISCDDLDKMTNLALIERYSGYDFDTIQKVINSYLSNDGIFVDHVCDDVYFIPKNNRTKVERDFYKWAVEILRLPAKLKSLWKLEQGDLNCIHYKEIMELFNFALVKEYNRKHIDELIKYGLINIDLNKNENDIKELKRIYKN